VRKRFCRRRSEDVMSPFVVILLSFVIAKSVLVATVLGATFLPDLSIPFYHPPKWPFGYDSSSSIFLPHDASKLGRVGAGLFRWDSVYFVSLADRGEVVWEQEWAFGPGWPALIRATAPGKSPSLYLLTGQCYNRTYHPTSSQNKFR
jgi:hypothetical protein